MNSVFCDMVSPYYEYSMYMCGFSKFRVLGTDADWELLHSQSVELFDLLGLDTEWSIELLCMIRMLTLVEFRTSIECLTDLFYTKVCGSGSQVEVYGWILKFFVDTPLVKYVCNYSTNVSNIQYKNLTTGKSYNMYSGLFGSTFENGYLLPDYGYYITPLLQD